MHIMCKQIHNTIVLGLGLLCMTGGFLCVLRKRQLGTALPGDGAMVAPATFFDIHSCISSPLTDEMVKQSVRK